MLVSVGAAPCFVAEHCPDCMLLTHPFTLIQEVCGAMHGA